MPSINESVSNWWRFLLGISIGFAVPGLIAWGVLSANVKANSNSIEAIQSDKLDVKVFEEYKTGIHAQFQNINQTLIVISAKLDNLIRDTYIERPRKESQ